MYDPDIQVLWFHFTPIWITVWIIVMLCMYWPSLQFMFMMFKIRLSVLSINSRPWPLLEFAMPLLVLQQSLFNTRAGQGLWISDHGLMYTTSFYSTLRSHDTLLNNLRVSYSSDIMWHTLQYCYALAISLCHSLIRSSYWCFSASCCYSSCR